MRPLSEIEREALTEIMNLGVGQAAASLSRMVKEEVILSVPAVDILMGSMAAALLLDNGRERLTAVRECFTGPVEGTAALIFPEAKSLELVRMVLDDTVTLDEVSELEQDSLIEIGNVVLNACLGSLGKTLNLDLCTEIPTLMQGDGEQIIMQTMRTKSGEVPMVLFLHIDFHLRSRDIVGHIALAMDVSAAERFHSLLADYVAALV